MKQPAANSPSLQAGSASLLIALVLSMSVTLVTLAVAKTQLAGQRISNNNHWKFLLELESQSLWSRTLTDLNENLETINWVSATDNEALTNIRSFTSSGNTMQSTVTLSRPGNTGRFINIQSVSRLSSDNGLSASFNQEVRLLTLLSPAIESPTPLILNGCITQASSSTHIKPMKSDTDSAGESIRLVGTRRCPPFPAIHLHQGSVNTQRLRRSLWSSLFTVSIEELTKMVKAEQPLPDTKRRYSIVQPADLVNGRWTQSVGSPERPVFLYFPSETGCPEFSPGVRIYGIVFIDGNCHIPIASKRFEIFGSLIINGDFNASGADLHLNHIQVADEQLTYLNFPVLRSVKVPGTWSDF